MCVNIGECVVQHCEVRLLLSFPCLRLVAVAVAFAVGFDESHVNSVTYFYRRAGASFNTHRKQSSSRTSEQTIHVKSFHFSLATI